MLGSPSFLIQVEVIRHIDITQQVNSKNVPSTPSAAICLKIGHPKEETGQKEKNERKEERKESVEERRKEGKKKGRRGE